MKFGMSWDVSGSTLGMFWDGFGRVSRKSSEEVQKTRFSKMSGSIFPTSGCPKQVFWTDSRTKISQKMKSNFVRCLWIFVYRPTPDPPPWAADMLYFPMYPLFGVDRWGHIFFYISGPDPFIFPIGNMGRPPGDHLGITWGPPGNLGIPCNKIFGSAA